MKTIIVVAAVICDNMKEKNKIMRIIHISDYHLDKKSANDSAASTSTSSLIWYLEFAVTYIDEKFFSKCCINFN